MSKHTKWLLELASHAAVLPVYEILCFPETSYVLSNE